MNTGEGSFKPVEEDRLTDEQKEALQEIMKQKDVPKKKKTPFKKIDTKSLFAVGEKLYVKDQPFEVVKITEKKIILKPLPFKVS